MKGTNFRRILCILIAAMLCIGLLPIGAAADSYAAATELRSMQKVRREIDGELFELESELDSDLSAVDTVDTLFEYLDGDSRIKSINRQNGTTFGYTLKSGMTVVYDYNIVHGIREGSEPVKSSFPLRKRFAVFWMTVRSRPQTGMLPFMRPIWELMRVSALTIRKPSLP